MYTYTNNNTQIHDHTELFNKQLKHTHKYMLQNKQITLHWQTNKYTYIYRHSHIYIHTQQNTHTHTHTHTNTHAHVHTQTHK